MPAPLILLLSDFGLSDGYVAAMKGVILSRCPHARLIDLTHQIPPQDILKAAIILAEVVPLYPPGACVLGVVDPGVGSSRRAVAIKTGSYSLVGPDNGLFSLLINKLEKTRRLSSLQIREITPGPLTRAPISNTFHGRDLFAPIAAHLAVGGSFSQVGPEGAPLCELQTPVPRREFNGIVGTVLVTDHFGNLITNVPGSWLHGLDPSCVVLSFEGSSERVAGLHDHFLAVAVGSPLLLVGSSGYLEVAVSMGSAAQILSRKPGDTFRISWR